MGKNNELMNNLIHKFAVPLSAVLFVAFFMTTAFILMTKVSWADDGQAPTSGRLITIHDRGVEKVIVSQATTISDALDEAGVTVDAKDSVEPALDEKLVASDYQVNIYRARPVIVIDGATQTKVMTPYQTATQIAESAGVKLYSEDKTSLRQADNIVAEGAGLQLIVDRATSFTFDLFGEVKTVRTQAETVDGMLIEKGIKMGTDDRLSIDKNSKITDGMSIRLWREGKQTISTEVAIDFPVEKIQDADREVGYNEVRTAGEKGLRTVTYEVLIQNGQEVSRTEIASLTTKAAKTEVVVVGVKRKVGSPDENKAYARAIMGGYGFGDDQWPCLEKLWTHESGWSQYAVNASSGAYGIPQALPGNKMGAGWQDDPVVQINWGLKYIKDRYKTPCGAYSHWQSQNWY